MAVAERGSFLWLMVAVTQVWLSIKLLAEAEEAVATLFGGGAAACIFLGIVVFRKEQRELLLNPLGNLSKEVHHDSIKKQDRGFMWTVCLWILALISGSLFL